MARTQLGTSDLKVNRMGLGCMGMSEFYGESDEQESIATLHGAIELGVDFYDTADMYGSGHNEALIGRAFAGKWDKVVLATKFGFIRDGKGGFAGLDCSPKHIQEACEASLKRLNTEVIDLYYAHRVDPNVPIEETVGAMNDLVSAGKIRYIGLSEASSEELRRASKEATITALQTEYSMWSRDVEEDILATCRDLDIAFVAYSPLGRGFLTGAITSRDSLDESDFRLHSPRFQEDTLEKNKAFLSLIEGIAKDKDATPAQIALAWVLYQGGDIFPIPGTRKMSRLRENLAALEIQFSDAELADIRSNLPTAEGGRY
ncbi:MAG TPA: aldo/keto reductase [Porticoccaceae bacterium]|nr:aldo/keto reductase [Porticoccaceae bacterium]